jgi:transposase-like protein
MKINEDKLRDKVNDHFENLKTQDRFCNEIDVPQSTLSKWRKEKINIGPITLEKINEGYKKLMK